MQVSVTNDGPAVELHNHLARSVGHKVIGTIEQVLADAKAHGLVGRNAAELVNRVAPAHRSRCPWSSRGVTSRGADDGNRTRVFSLGGGPTAGRKATCIEAAASRCLSRRRVRDELISPPDTPSDKIGVPHHRLQRNVVTIPRTPRRRQPIKPRFSPMPRRDSSKSRNHWISLHHLSGRAERVMSGRVSRKPTINPRHARIGAMRFGLRKARAAESAEPQRDYRGTGCNCLQAHDQLLCTAGQAGIMDTQWPMPQNVLTPGRARNRARPGASPSSHPAWVHAEFC